MRRLFAHRAALAALVLSVSGQAAAGGPAEIEGILDEPIVTTASHASETASVAPGTMTVVSSEELRQHGIHTLLEAIDFLSLGLTSGANPNGGEIGARGVLLTGDGGNHVLLMINGHAINEPLSGGVSFDRTAGIPMELVDHIEVIVGAGSVLYGTGAMLGVIDVVTKRADAFAGTHLVVEASSLTSERALAGGGYSFRVLGAPSELTAAVEYYTSSVQSLTLPREDSVAGPYAWGGAVHHSDYSTVPAATLRFLSGNLEINARGVADTVGLPLSELSFDNSLNRRVEDWASVDIAYRATLSAIAASTTRLYGDSVDRVTHTISPAFASCPAAACDFRDSGTARWVGIEQRVELDWLGNRRLTTLLGVDARVRYDEAEHDTVDPVSARALLPPSAHFDKVDVPIGAYAQQTWRATRWLALNGGLRADEDARFPVALSPRLAATALPWKGGTLKAAYSQAFRAPSWMETDIQSLVQLPAQNLQPERVSTYEASFEQAFGAQKLLYGVFASRWSNLVELHTLDTSELQQAAASGALGDRAYSPNLDIQQYRNIDTVNNVGFNMAYVGFVGRFRYAANVTGATARDQDGPPLTVTPALFGNARFAYDLPGAGPTVAFATHFSGTRLVNRAYTQGYSIVPSAPPVFELLATVSGRVPFVKGLSFRASAKYAVQTYEPYVVGPVPNSTSSDTSTDLLPSQRFEATVGLHYVL